MHVTHALDCRYTCRAFRGDPVTRATVEAILAAASRAPSGGNLQPWRVWAVAGAARQSLVDAVKARIAAGDLTDGEPEYFIYPQDLPEPWASRKFTTAEGYYEALGVAREDNAARLHEYVRNFEFFGAPVGLIFAIDRRMQPGQWADLGMFLQSIMLAARDYGLDTAALESWSLWHATVRTALNIPPELMIFCGMALGHADPENSGNAYRSPRAGLDEFAALSGFES